MNKTEFPISHHDAEIDATLSLLANATAAAGLEQRIQLRLADAGPVRRHGFFTSKLFRVSHNSTRRGFMMQTMAASLVAITAVVAGVLLYTPHRAPVAPPIMHALPSANGFGAASAIRIAPQPIKPALHSHGRGTASRGHGRAAIGNHHQPLPPGVAVPHSPPPKAAPSEQ